MEVLVTLTESTEVLTDERPGLNLILTQLILVGVGWVTTNTYLK